MTTEPTITYRLPTSDEIPLLSLTPFIVRRIGGPARTVRVYNYRVYVDNEVDIVSDNFTQFEISFDGKTWRPFGTPVERKVVWKCVVEKGMRVRYPAGHPHNGFDFWCCGNELMTLNKHCDVISELRIGHEAECCWGYETEWRPAFIQVPEGEA